MGYVRAARKPSLPGTALRGTIGDMSIRLVDERLAVRRSPVFHRHPPLIAIVRAILIVLLFEARLGA
jgi:hypothetical protein